MNIDKISGIGPVYGPKKPGKLNNNIEPITSKQDKIEISEEAKKLHLSNLIKETLNVSDPERLNKIKEIKEKLKEGFYDNLNDDILNATADKLYDQSQDLIRVLKPIPPK